MNGYVRLEENGVWIPAIIRPSMFGGYDAKISDFVFCGISEQNVKIEQP